MPDETLTPTPLATTEPDAPDTVVEAATVRVWVDAQGQTHSELERTPDPYWGYRDAVQRNTTLDAVQDFRERVAPPPMAAPAQSSPAESTGASGGESVPQPQPAGSEGAATPPQADSSFDITQLLVRGGVGGLPPLATLRGVNSAIVNSVKSIDDLTQYVGKMVGAGGTHFADSVPGIQGLPEAQSIPEHMVEGLIQWATIFVPMAVAVPEVAVTGAVAGMSRGAAMLAETKAYSALSARLAALGTLSEIMSMDPYKQDISSMLDTFGVFPAFSRWMRADPNDPREEARMKQAIASTITNVAGEVIGGGILAVFYFAKLIATKNGPILDKIKSEIADAIAATKQMMEDERGAVSTKMLVPDVFYSPTARVIEESLPQSATPQQIRATLDNAGVPKEEREWMGLEEFLKGKSKVSKAELQNYVREHSIQIEEVTRAGEDTTHQALTLPNGKNYREVLLTLPANSPAPGALSRYEALGNILDKRALTPAEDAEYQSLEKVLTGTSQATGDTFRSSHFPDNPNILAHARLTDRVDPEGRRVLFIEELQSDWHQTGRKEGYRITDTRQGWREDANVFVVYKPNGTFVDVPKSEAATGDAAVRYAHQHPELPEHHGTEYAPGVPDAPFKKTWPELTIKRILRMAAEEGYDRVAWTTGEQQVIRNTTEGMSPESVSRITKGMTGFYDEMLPNTVNSYLKKFGAKVEAGHVRIGPSDVPVHTLPIPPKIAQLAAEHPQSLMGKSLTFEAMVPRAEDAVATLTPIQHAALVSKFSDTATSETGSALRAATHALARAAAGALIGPMVGDPEDAVRNALIGAGLGAFASPSLIKKLIPDAVKAHAPRSKRNPVPTADVDPSPFATIHKSYMEALTKQEVSHVEKWGEAVVTRSDEAAKELARQERSAGRMSEDVLAALNPRTVLNQPQKMAMTEVLTKANLDLLKLAHEIDPMNPADIRRLFEKVSYNAVALDAKALGVETEIGRALRADLLMAKERAFNEQFRELYKNLPATPQNAAKMVEALKNMPSMDQMALFLHQLKKSTWKDVVTELWYSALLSAFPTHLANLIGNASTMIMLTTERAVAARLPGSVGGVNRYGAADLTNLPVEVGEASQMWKGFAEGFWEILRAGREGFRDATELTGVLKAEALKPAISSEALQATGPYGQFLDWIGPKIRIPGRALGASDAFFKAALTRMEQRALAHRHAMAAVRDQALTGADAEKAYATAFADLMANPPEAFVGKTQSFAEYGTFTQPLTGGPIEESIMKFGSSPLGRIIIPFKVTPVNLTKFAANRTPLGFFAESLRKDFAAGGATRDLALARVAVGNVATAGFGYLAYQGIISGAGPDKSHPGLRSIMQDLGWRPYSINVSAFQRFLNPLDGDGGTEWKKGDTILQYNKLAPLGAVMGWAADVADAAVNAADADQSTLENLVTTGEAMSLAAAMMFTQGPYVKGVADAFRAMAEPETSGPGFLRNFMSSGIPQVFKKAAQEIDPVVRDIDRGPRGYIDALLAGIPGLSSTLPPRLDRITGDPIYRPGPFGWRFVSPVGMTDYTADPVMRELANAKVDPSGAPDQISGVPLSREQKAMWITLATKGALPNEPPRTTLYERLKTQIERIEANRPDASPEYRHYVYGEIIADYAAMATARMEGEMRAAIIDKLRKDNQKLRGPAPAPQAPAAIGVQ